MVTVNYKDDSWLNKTSYQVKTLNQVIEQVSKDLKLSDTDKKRLKKEHLLRLPGVTIWLTK